MDFSIKSATTKSPTQFVTAPKQTVAPKPSSRPSGSNAGYDMFGRPLATGISGSGFQTLEEIQPLPGGSGGSGGYADPAAAARAAQEAADNARRGQLKTEATGLLQNLMGAYDSLFGNVRSAAKSQNDALDKRYNQEVTGLTDQFNQELPKVGRAYAARGTFDSSYRGDAEQQATTGFNNQIQDIGTQREADAAKIGQFVAEKEGMVNAEKGLLAKMLGDLPNVNDLNELTQLKQSIDRKIADVQSAQAGTQSQEAYSAKLGEIAPGADRMGALQTTLTNIVNGAAPGALKRAVAQQVIGSSGLTEEQQRQLLGEVNSQIV